MEKKRESEDVSPVMALLVLGFGGLAYWWWWLGEEGRRGLLRWIGREGGYGQAPSDILEQVEWLLTNRMEDLQGMFLLFVLMSAAGALEGNARRQTEILAGFGLRRLRAGRLLVLVWLVVRLEWIRSENTNVATSGKPSGAAGPSTVSMAPYSRNTTGRPAL